MALTKTPVSLNFAQGMNQKADPFQLPIGQFQNLTNSVFDKAGRLTKRNGFQNTTALPNANQTTLTTFSDNLIATGSSLYSYSSDLNQWLNKGPVQPIQLNVQSLVRNSSGQSAPDMAVSSNGLVCLVYLDADGNSYYQVSDYTTGNQVVARTMLPATANTARVALLGNYFIITFFATVSAATHLQYIAIPIASPSNAGTATDISNDNQSSPCYDISSVGTALYVGWMSATADTFKILFIRPSLALSPTTTQSTTFAIARVTVHADPATGVVWAGFSPPAGSNSVSVSAFNSVLAQIMASTTALSNLGTGSNLVLASSGRVATVLANGLQTVTHQGTLAFLDSITITLPASGGGTGTVGTLQFVETVAVASKPFVDNGVIYFLAAYGNCNQSNPALNSNQPTYFLMDANLNVYARLAYSNGGGYPQTQVLPSVSFYNNQYVVPYQIKDFLASVNKGTDLATGTPTAAIFTLTGINSAEFSLNTTAQYNTEIANVLNLTGGILWQYDGVKPVENGFHVWPENIAVSTATTTGFVPADTYYYVFTYEWTDNQGNLYRSAPSIPVSVTTTGSTSINTLFVPNLGITYKTGSNPVRIVGYRWSLLAQAYYQFTSITSPVLNAPASSTVQTITDSNLSVVGNTLLYTTGGVVEDIAAPPSIGSCLFNNRLWLIDAEDRNLLWFSKQVIEDTPVEMSDLLTLYVAPTTGAQHSTGPMTAISAMDDKLIIFKKDAIYYVNGIGPDNTGANSQYSDAIFITGTVGCANPNSIVLTPTGLMFQSDKGIWQLGRGLDTTYIGAQVEDLSLENTVVSAEAIPATNQVRFILDNSQTLMYDYFYNQWAVHTNVNAISSTLYQSAHTYLNKYGQVFQETSDYYSDGSSPVLMALTTSWISVAGLQGFERFYAMNLLGTYFTPFKLNVSMAYNYSSGPLQSVIVSPDNYTKPWGGEANWGTGATWGVDIDNASNVFSARVFPEVQKCETFQVSIQEVFDPSFGTQPGQGLSLSGLLLLVGMKRGSRTQSARRSFG